MLSDQVAVIIFEGDFRLSGFIQSGAAETDRCVCCGHFHPRYKKEKRAKLNCDSENVN